MSNRIPWRDRAILIVDDDEMSRSLISEVLSGSRILQAESGEKALELIDRGARPELVISDYNMSGMTGVETIQEIRKRLPWIPCVLISGSESHEIAALAAQAGANAWLKKPFGDISLFEQIKSLLKSSPETLSEQPSLYKVEKSSHSC